MDWLYTWEAWAASAAFIGVALIPLGTFWGFNLCGRRGGQQAQPLRLTRIFLHMALPAYILAVAAAIVYPVTAVMGSIPEAMSSLRNFRAGIVGFYGSAVSKLLITAAGVIASQAIYLAGLCVWYLVLAKQKWWNAVQLDTICATALLIILDIAWFAKRISDFVNNNEDRVRLEWLLVMIDLTLCLVAALNVGLAIYCAAKLKRRGDLSVGNLPTLFLSASLLWLIRCAFVLTVDLRDVIPDWTLPEILAQKFIYPIFDYWISATVLGLVTFMVRNRVWSDPSVFADRGDWQQQQMYVQPVSQYLAPHYGQQQQQGQVLENPHQYYQQQQSSRMRVD